MYLLRIDRRRGSASQFAFARADQGFVIVTRFQLARNSGLVREKRGNVETFNLGVSAYRQIPARNDLAKGQR